MLAFKVFLHSYILQQREFVPSSILTTATETYVEVEENGMGMVKILDISNQILLELSSIIFLYISLAIPTAFSFSSVSSQVQTASVSV